MLVRYSTKCDHRGRLSRRYSVLDRLAVDNSYCDVLNNEQCCLCWLDRYRPNVY